MRLALDSPSGCRLHLRRQCAAEASGLRFSLKDFRSTFAEVAKDHGASIKSVSRAMRHPSTKTTEAYYARISPKAAFQELRERCAPEVTRTTFSPGQSAPVGIRTGSGLGPVDGEPPSTSLKSKDARLYRA
jgi:hypothetical protein